MTEAALKTAVSSGFPFPKSARLRKHRDFQFRAYGRFHSDLFRFVFTSQGQGRLGMSLSRKVLRNAVARNRVRRLLKEAFRLDRMTWEGIDLHVIGQRALADRWETLVLADIAGELDRLRSRVG